MKQEENYTSKASSLDQDELLVWCVDDKRNNLFIGKRLNRGQYQCLSWKYIHADINGALNILRNPDVLELPK